MQKVDFTTFKSGDSVENKASTVNKRWWLASKDELAQSVTRIVKMLMEFDSKRQSQYQISTRLYGNVTMMGVNGLSMTKASSTANVVKERTSYNVVQSCGDTITAKMAKNKPKPYFLTSGGDYMMQRKAKKLNKFTDGIFYENHAYRKGVDAFRDSFIWGDGIIQVYEHHKRVKWDRVLASEIYVDWAEAFNGMPRQLHRVKNIDRDVLIEMFPGKAKLLATASSTTSDLTGVYQNVADQITVCESWHLPSGPDAKDGIHCITIPEGELFSEDYKKDFFPFAFLPWSKRQFGWWAQGGAEQIQSIQLEMNKLLWLIQRSMQLSGTFKILMENGSKIVKEHFNNDVGTILTYSNTPPQYIVPPIVPMEMYSHFERLKGLAFDQIGVSMLSAASEKPQGLNSGKALREYNDIESDRFNIIGQRYENFFLDLAKLSIDCAKDIYETEGEFKVKVPGKRFIEEIDWAEIDLEDDEYVMKAFPVSSLPDEPAGRLQAVQEFIQAGFYTPRQGKRLMDFPDLEQIDSLQDSQEDYLHMVFEKMLDADGEFTPPEPQDDLVLAQEMYLEYYSQAKLAGASEEKLDLLRTFASRVQDLQDKAKAAAAAQQAAAQAAMAPPQAAPQDQPQSDLVQNVPGSAA
jgi:hypothetical protein